EELAPIIDQMEEAGTCSSEEADRFREARIRRLRELAVSVVPAPRTSPEPVRKPAPARSVASVATVRRPAAQQQPEPACGPAPAATAPVYVVAGGVVITAAGEQQP